MHEQTERTFPWAKGRSLMSKKGSTVYVENKECDYCGKVVDQTGSWKADRKYCRFKYPDCFHTHKNFKRSLEHALEEENENIRLTAEWIQEQLLYKIPPIVFHPLLSLTVRTKKLARQIALVKK